MLADERVVSAAAGAFHSMAVTADGKLFGFGYAAAGALGLGEMWQAQVRPARVAVFAEKRVVSVAAGAHHTLAITADGALFTFGLGANGKLGHGDTLTQKLPKRAAALAKHTVVHVGAGRDHSIAIAAAGTVFSWGEGTDGRLGHGDDTSNQLRPKQVHFGV